MMDFAQMPITTTQKVFVGYRSMATPKNNPGDRLPPDGDAGPYHYLLEVHLQGPTKYKHRRIHLRKMTTVQGRLAKLRRNRKLKVLSAAIYRIHEDGSVAAEPLYCYERKLRKP